MSFKFIFFFTLAFLLLVVVVVGYLKIENSLERKQYALEQNCEITGFRYGNIPNQNKEGCYREDYDDNGTFVEVIDPYTRMGEKFYTGGFE